ncbi:hypothetical protein LSH36_32g05070 [Paralvinella palmiformis]|uniref:C-type lectin domain-containing protein n=1 Tax=Paralvinella palmiformis TaxID=53620 RepID=A0AAD9NEH2_9ANNE|nr:hypothetical protein LSH36_32g05070 [Paralvinella palmiformis]
MSGVVNLLVATLTVVLLNAGFCGANQLEANEGQFQVQPGLYVEGNSFYTETDVDFYQCLLRCLSLQARSKLKINQLATHYAVDSKYVFIKRLVTRDQAAATCSQLNMDLVSVESIDEVPLIHKLISGDTHTSGNFTGTANKFVWVTGAMLPPPGDELWADYQPEENDWDNACITMIKTETSLKFNDGECDYLAYITCERN